MADYYVWSGATGVANGSSWTDAYTTLAAAASGKTAGSRYLLASDHAESTAGAISITFPGTTSSPDQIFAVDRLTGLVVTTPAAQITTTGNNNISMDGYYDIEGVKFTIGSGATTSRTLSLADNLRNCAIVIGGGNGSTIIPGSGNNRCIWDNVSLTFANASDGISAAYSFEWRNTPTAINGLTFPTSLFTGGSGSAIVQGVDLSNLGTGKYIALGGIFYQTKIVLHDCKLGVGVGLATGIYSYRTLEVVMTRCDDGSKVYRHEKQNYLGKQSIETTIIRSGGASDGITPISWNITTSASAKFMKPFQSLPMLPVWNDTTGASKTVTVYGVWGGGSVPNNDDIWIEVQYLGDSGSPLASFVTTRKMSRLVAGSAVPSDSSSTWGGGTTKFALSASFTPNQKGHIIVRVFAAKASSTFYIDPAPVIT